LEPEGSLQNRVPPVIQGSAVSSRRSPAKPPEPTKRLPTKTAGWVA